MTVLDHIPGLKGTGTRRAVDKIAELRDENRRLLDRQLAADDFFAIQSQLITDLEGDVRDLRRQLANEQQRRDIAQKERDQAEAVIRLRDQRIAELKRRLKVGVLAEAAAVKTQEIDARSLRDNYADGVLTLPQAHGIGPVLDPGRVHTEGVA